MKDNVYSNRTDNNKTAIFIFVALYGIINAIIKYNDLFVFLLLLFWTAIIVFMYKNKILGKYGISLGKYNKPSILISLLFFALIILRHTVERLLYNSEYNLSALKIILIVSAAFGEELFFRGIVFNYLRTKFFNLRLPLIISSVLFAAFHIVNVFDNGILYTLVQILFACSAGMCFALIYYLTKSLSVPVLLHIITNLFSGQNTVENSVITVFISAVLIIIPVIYLLNLEKKNETVH